VGHGVGLGLGEGEGEGEGDGLGLGDGLGEGLGDGLGFGQIRVTVTCERPRRNPSHAFANPFSGHTAPRWMST
jgi:hypothetical protein